MIPQRTQLDSWHISCLYHHSDSLYQILPWFWFICGNFQPWLRSLKQRHEAQTCYLSWWPQEQTDRENQKWILCDLQFFWPFQLATIYTRFCHCCCKIWWGQSVCVCSIPHKEPAVGSRDHRHTIQQVGSVRLLSNVTPNYILKNTQLRPHNASILPITLKFNTKFSKHVIMTSVTL